MIRIGIRCEDFSRIVSAVSCLLTFAVLLPSPVHSAESAKEKISVAYASISPSMSAVWMAKEIGAFERNGLNAELVYISSGATTVQALVGGSVQAALGASNAVVAAALKGAPIIAVASITFVVGALLLKETHAHLIWKELETAEPGKLVSDLEGPV